MEGVSIVPTETLQALIGTVEKMELIVVSTLAQLKEFETKKWMTINEVVEFTGLSRSTVNVHRIDIGFSGSGNCIRFKRSDVEEFMELNYSKKSKKRKKQ
jgi:excisionase family DNA binding protein